MAQRRPDGGADIGSGNEKRYRIESLLQCCDILQRLCKPPAKQSRPRSGDGSIDCIEQASPRFTAQPSRQFEIVARRGIDAHHRLGGLAPRRPQGRSPTGLSHHDVVKKTTECSNFASREGAKTIECCDLEMLLEAPFAGAALETAGGKHG